MKTGKNMSRARIVAAAVLALAVTGCGNYTLPTEVAPAAGTPGSSVTVKNCDQLFALRVQPRLDYCRNCHVPGGVADVPDGHLYMLSQDKTQDFANLRASWEALGRNDNGKSRILKMASGTDTRSHTGGSPWPVGSDAYKEMDAQLLGFVDPSACNLGVLGGVTQELPLLGDLEATGGRNYAAVYCEGKADGEALPRDPRELIAGDNLDNKNYAVYYNDPFEICETPTLLETQARQNALLGFSPTDPKRVYTAKPRPTTCGEWRTSVENGRKYIMSNPITGAVLTSQSLYNLFQRSGTPIPSDPEKANALIAQVAQQRYGWPAHPYPNPFPRPGEDPNKTNGGSLQLPVALVQVKNDDGSWSGKIGVTCFACHIGQIGTGEVVGNSAKRDGHPELYGGSKSGMFVSLNGSNTDTGLSLYDLELANPVGPDSFRANLDTPGYLANRTRGTNAADQEIVNVLYGRDLDTLDFRSPALEPDLLGKLLPSVPLTGGDQDMPTWWWTHNKTRYLWVGFGSAGSSRGNFFPSSTNPNDGHWSKHREGDYLDLDMWLNAVEAPAWPAGYCSNADGTPAAGDKPHCINRPLAERGAILFHNKNLWAASGNADIPKPPGGNGSCAGCHGAYSPRFINQPGFLPDPSLAGMSGYTVPLEIVNTDPQQSFLFTGPSYGGSTLPVGVDLVLTKSWFSYPDALKGYRLPEEKTALEEATDDFSPPPSTRFNCMTGTKGGYTAQPLHGVWASGPYLHNGSVPTVWGVLKPADRPDVWLRQRVPESEGAPPFGDRGFDTDMVRAYDYEKLGWRYERLSCDARTDVATALSCQPSAYIPTVLDLFLTPVKAAADFISPPYVGLPGQGEVYQREIYNTHAYSKGNAGHAFTKILTDEERAALIEYLKTL